MTRIYPPPAVVDDHVVEVETATGAVDGTDADPISGKRPARAGFLDRVTNGRVEKGPADRERIARYIFAQQREAARRGKAMEK